MRNNDKPSIDLIRDWWNSHSYSYGINSSNDDYLDTGIPKNFTKPELFSEYERKYRKHLTEASDSLGRIAGRFIPYDWIADKSVLDVACGLGWATVSMAESGARVESIDLTPKAVEFTKEYLNSRGLNAKVSEMSAENLHFPDNHFDFVLGWGFIMHTENPELALKEMIRVTRSGGKIVLYFYYKHSISYWWNIIILRGILLGYLLRFRMNTTKLVSRFTDGITVGGNSKTLVLSRTWFKANALSEKALEIKFIGWGPPSLLDSFPIRRIPLGKFLPGKFKEIWSRQFGFGHICIIDIH